MRVLQHPTPLAAAALTFDGKLLATGGEDKLVYLWKTSGETVGTLGGFATSITALAFARDGKHLAIGTSGELYLVELGGVPPAVSKRQRLLNGQYVVSAVAFSPDGKSLAACNYDGVAFQWDVVSGTRTGVANGLSPNLTALAYAPDNRRLAIAGREGHIHVWSVGQPPLQLERRLSTGSFLAFAPAPGH